MSQRCKGARQSVTSASRKQTADQNCISVNSCNCSRSVLGVMDGDESQKNKVKRLRSRKERNQARGSGDESNRKSHHRHHYHHLHHRNHLFSKDKPQPHCCSKTSSQCPQRKKSNFAQVFPSTQEPSVITTNRLIGHQGLFNHEVKSIDIERLLSEQRKRGRRRQPGLQENNLDAIHLAPNPHPLSPCSSSEANLAKFEDVLRASDSDVALYQEKTSVDCQSNTHGSDITPGQRSQMPGISPEQPTNSPCVSLKRKSKKTKAVMSIMEKDTTGRNENGRPELEKVNTQMNATTPQSQTLVCEHSPNSPHPLWCNSISAVAGRLCDSLKLQLLVRKDVLAESREVLLLAIQERHGARFWENQLGVQRRLSFGKHTVQGPDVVPPVTTSDDFFTAIQGKAFDQSCSETHKKAPGKSSRKLNHSNWKPPPQTNQDVEWMASPSVDRVEVRDALDELLRPNSCSWSGLDLGPSASSPSDHYSSCPPMSRWPGVDPPMPQPWDRLSSTRIRESADIGRDEGCLLNQAPALHPPDSGRHPFLCHPPEQPGGHPVYPKCHPEEHAAVEIGPCPLAHSSSTRYCQKEDYQHPCYHFNHHPTHLFPPPYHGDLMHYPPSDLLDGGLSPPLASGDSPVRWSFPPMRLY